MTHALVAQNFPIPSALGSIDAYVGAVNRIPVLTLEEEQALARNYIESIHVTNHVNRNVSTRGANSS